jgi:hypothetical protein
MKNSSRENTKHTKKIQEIAEHIKYKYGLSEWSAKVLVNDIVELYNRSKSEE